MTLGLAAAIALPAALWFRVDRVRRANPAREAVASFERALTDVGTSVQERLSGTSDRERELERENAELRTMVEQVLEPLERENAELRAACGFLGRSPGLIAAEVLSFGGSDAWGQRLRIGKGSLAGIATNAPVLVERGLVGHVVEVSPHTATVMLLSDINSRVSCEVVGSDGTNVLGILVGGGSSGFVTSPMHVEYLDRHRDVAKGSVVKTSGLGGLYPRAMSRLFPQGIVLGTAGESSLDAAGLFRRLDVAPVTEFGALRTVYVLSGWEGGR